MCNPLMLLSTGLQVVSAVSSKNAADKAAAKALEAGNFNAEIIERDIDLLEKSQNIYNANFLVSQNRAAINFERDIQSQARVGFGYAGVDMSQGTPIAVLRQSAREFDYEQKVREFDNSVVNMQRHLLLILGLNVLCPRSLILEFLMIFHPQIKIDLSPWVLMQEKN